ncbi:hypothetical protein OVA29_21870 [Exiguobacterium sp. SL14]|nr:hypothetical protein [Exiguobacterium sp. SL14]
MAAKEITNDSVCAKQLQNWISFFKDKHLRIKYSKPKSAINSKTESKKIEILSRIRLKSWGLSKKFS